MGTMLENLVAATVVIIVGGAIVGMVFKLLWGNRREDRALKEIAEQYKAPGKKAGKDSGTEKRKK